MQEATGGSVQRQVAGTGRGERFRERLRSLIVPAGEQNTVLSYSNIGCESVNEVKRRQKKCVVSGTEIPLGSELTYLAGVAEANAYNM